MFSVLIFLFGSATPFVLNLRFLSILMPLLGTFFFIESVNMASGRIGFYAIVVWLQVVAVFLVGNSVYGLSVEGLRRLAVLTTALLFAQYVFVRLFPDVFSAVVHNLGVRDSFTIYGTYLGRVYYGYLNANVAAYTIFYIGLGWLAIHRVIDGNRFVFIVVLGVLSFLAYETGGRGVVLLTALFGLVWFLFRKGTASGTLFVAFCVGTFAALPVLNALLDFIFSRDASNFNRLVALEQYRDYILEYPLFGQGVNQIRIFVSEEGLKPSHNFFIEMIAMFGVVFGGFVVVFLFYILVVRVKYTDLKIIGLFALAPGMLNNSLWTMWGFFPFIVPVLLSLSAYRERLNASDFLPGNPALKNRIK